MAYTANLGNNQQLTIVNQEKQTSIALFSSTPGQQQSQTSNLTTGTWIKPPRLYKIQSGFILEINSDLQQHFVLIQNNSISAIAAPPLQNAVKIDLEYTPQSDRDRIEFEPMQPMQPMQSMQPMKMGNMSMSMNPMSMRMGNMSMSMEESNTTASAKNFCSQCGSKIKQSDRFCSNCGNKLDN